MPRVPAPLSLASQATRTAKSLLAVMQGIAAEAASTCSAPGVACHPAGGGGQFNTGCLAGAGMCSACSGATGCCAKALPAAQQPHAW